MVGPFINTLPVRVNVDGERDLWDWLRELQARQAELREYEHSPLVDVQGWSEVPRGQPLFEALFVFESYLGAPSPNGSAPAEGALRVRPHAVVEHTSYPLALAAAPGDGIYLRLEYGTDRIDGADARRLARHFQRALEGFVARPDLRVGDVEILDDGERRELHAGARAPAGRARGVRGVGPPGPGRAGAALGRRRPDVPRPERASEPSGQVPARGRRRGGVPRWRDAGAVA
jgi:non-ribosomal peptide synthetase component F